jgi:MoaA/NifB/PqqE/SkfB family radical SAM enzyme
MKESKSTIKSSESNNLPVAPKTVDFNVIGKCNLDCVWCWGPDHKTKHTLNAADWIETATQLRKMGTENIVITGGEPTLRKDLLEMVEGFKGLGMRVTLSTNAMLLLNERNKKLLEYVDEIGIPLDGATEEMNNVMRKGNKEAFNLAIEAIKYIQEKHPNIKMTIRTVLSRKNLDDVQSIPNTLSQKGVDLTKFRWKIYQITPTGPREAQKTLEENGWLISEEETKKIVDFLKQSHPQMTISSLMSKEHDSRYLHIDPTGKITTLVGEDPQHLEVGSVYFSNKDTISLIDPIDKLKSLGYSINGISHGTDNFRL